jgi:hypothetical protein
MDSDREQSGYYQEIARVFLARRGGALLLSPKDLSTIAAWEEKRIPLDAVVEGIGRTFEGLKARGRATRTVSLAFCDRQVEAAFDQHRDRAAGRRTDPGAGAGTDKAAKVRGEIDRALGTLPAGDLEMKRLFRKALEAIAGSGPDPAALERIDAEIEEALWSGATAAEKAAAESESLKAHRGRKPAGFEDTVRRRAVMAARARRRLPHVSLHYY